MGKSPVATLEIEKTTLCSVGKGGAIQSNRILGFQSQPQDDPPDRPLGGSQPKTTMQHGELGSLCWKEVMGSKVSTSGLYPQYTNHL